MRGLPDWFELDGMKTEGEEFTALEKFIYDQEPAGEHSDEFRKQLLAVVNEAEGG